MAQTSDIERAAQAAAERVKELLIDMLAANELGEVAVVVGYTQLEPEKRLLTKSKVIRVARGQLVAIEHVEQIAS